MTTNLLKRLESSIHSFRLTLESLQANNLLTLSKIAEYQKTGKKVKVVDALTQYEDTEPDDDELPGDDSFKTGGKVQVDLDDMDVPGWKADLEADLLLINELLADMSKVTPEEDSKLQHLKSVIRGKLEVIKKFLSLRLLLIRPITYTKI
jgi:hypothetical protein